MPAVLAAGGRVKHCTFSMLVLVFNYMGKREVKQKEKMLLPSAHWCLDPTFLNN